MMEDEALNYEKGEAEETAHSVCTRQLMDDANRLKCSKYQQTNAEGSWGLRELKSVVGLQRKLRAFEKAKR